MKRMVSSLVIMFLFAFSFSGVASASLTDLTDQCLSPGAVLALPDPAPALHVPVPDKESLDRTILSNRYVLNKRFDSGAFGEIWYAFPLNDHKENGVLSSNLSNQTFHAQMFIIKRLMVEKGKRVYRSGVREKYFGEKFQLARSNEDLQVIAYEEGLKYIARYVETLEPSSNEIWVVFHHEGISLLKLLYTSHAMERPENTENEIHMKHATYARFPSNWWRWLKLTKAGQAEMRNLIWQLLMALKSCHDRKITHRGIKPGNIVICFEEWVTRRCLKGFPSGNGNYTTKMRIVDFGSAVDGFTLKHLYGTHGPSRKEQTFDYMPPEAFLNVRWWSGLANITMKYDMWSVGVVMLELTIGSPKVFDVDLYTLVLLNQRFEGWSEGYKELIFRLRSFTELCILPTGKEKYSGVPASWKCSEEFFSRQIKSRDVLGIGFSDVWAMRLVRQLLIWDPEDRLTVDDALRHPYFLQHETPLNLTGDIAL